MYTFNWALTAFRSESYIGSATALPDNIPNLCLWCRLVTTIIMMASKTKASSRPPAPAPAIMKISCFDKTESTDTKRKICH